MLYIFLVHKKAIIAHLGWSKTSKLLKKYTIFQFIASVLFMFRHVIVRSGVDET